MVNHNNIFKGDCYICSKKGFITRVDSWKGQRASDGTWIKGSWRMFCDDCVKEWGWKPNREPNTCIKCGTKFIGQKDATICKKCGR